MSSMNRSKHCQRHPDREAVVNCQKLGHGWCRDCLENDPHCPDPDLYCKFRSACVIYFNLKEKKKEAAQG